MGANHWPLRSVTGASERQDRSASGAPVRRMAYGATGRMGDRCVSWVDRQPTTHVARERCSPQASCRSFGNGPEGPQVLRCTGTVRTCLSPACSPRRGPAKLLPISRPINTPEPRDWERSAAPTAKCGAVPGRLMGRMCPIYGGVGVGNALANRGDLPVCCMGSVWRSRGGPVSGRASVHVSCKSHSWPVATAQRLPAATTRALGVRLSHCGASRGGDVPAGRVFAGVVGA